MVPIEIWGIIFSFALLLLVFGMMFKQPWARIFGSLFLMIAGIVMLFAGGIQTGYLLTDSTLMTYTAVGVATTEPWLFSFGVAIILIGFLTVFWGSTKTKKMNPFFDYG